MTDTATTARRLAEPTAALLADARRAAPTTRRSRAPVPRVSVAQVEAITDPVERRDVPEADGRVAGAGRRHRVHAAAGRKDRALRPAAGGDRSRQAAVLRDRDDRSAASRPAARREPQGPADEDRRQPASIPASLGATDVFAQAAILGLYDPDRSQTLTHSARSGRGRRSSAPMRAALAAQQPLKGAGLRILTETVTSPTLAAQLRELLARFPAAKWHQ